MEVAPVANNDLTISENDSAQQVETKITKAFNKYFLSDMDKTITTLFNNIEATFLDSFIDYNLAQNLSTDISSEELFGKLLNAVDLRYEYSVENNHVSYVLEITIVNEKALGLEKVFFMSKDHEGRKVKGSLDPGQNITFRYVSDDLYNKSVANSKPKTGTQARNSLNADEELSLNIVPDRGRDGNLRPAFNDTKIMFVVNNGTKYAHVLNGENATHNSAQLHNASRGLVLVPENIIDPSNEPQFVIDHVETLQHYESILQNLGWTILADTVATTTVSALTMGTLVTLGVVTLSGVTAGTAAAFGAGAVAAILPTAIGGMSLGALAGTLGTVLAVVGFASFAIGIALVLAAIALLLTILILNVPPIILKYEQALDVSYNIPDVKWETYVNGSNPIINNANFKESISESFKKQLNEKYNNSIGSRTMVMRLVENIINQENPELRTIKNTFNTDIRTNSKVTENVRNLSALVSILSYGILADGDLNKHLGWDSDENKEKLEKSLKVLQVVSTHDPVNVSAGLIVSSLQQYKPKIMDKLFTIDDAIGSAMLGMYCSELDDLIMNQKNYDNGKIVSAIRQLDEYINSPRFTDDYTLKANSFAKLTTQQIEANVQAVRDAWNGNPVGSKDSIKYCYDQIAGSLITWNDKDNIPTQDQLNKYAYKIDKEIIDGFMPKYLENAKVANEHDKPTEEKPSTRAAENSGGNSGGNDAENDKQFTVQQHFENILSNSSLKKDAVMPLLAIIHQGDNINPDNQDLLTSFMRFAQYKDFKFEYLTKSEKDIKGLVKSGQIHNNETIVPYHIGRAFEHDFCYQNLEIDQFRSILKFFYTGYELTDKSGTHQYSLSELLQNMKLDPIAVPIFNVATDDTVTVEMKQDVAGNKDEPVNLRYDFDTDLTGNNNVVRKTNISDIAYIMNYDDIHKDRKEPVIGVRDFMNPNSGAHTPTADVKSPSKVLTTHSTSVFFPHFSVDGKMIAKYDNEIGNYVLEQYTPENGIPEGQINLGVPYIHFNQTSIFDHNVLSDSIAYGASRFKLDIKGRLVPSTVYLLREYKYMFDAFASPFYNVLSVPEKK